MRHVGGHPAVQSVRHEPLIITTTSDMHIITSTSSSILLNETGIATTSIAKSNSSSIRMLFANGAEILLCDYESATKTRYRLRGNDDGTQPEIAHITFMPNGQEFLFWTKGSNVVVGYSIVRSAVTPFSCIHPNTPTCLAISPRSRYVVTCSRKPATVYLHDMRHPKSQVLVRLHRTTRSHVVVTAFHPERDGVFLLGHADGTVSVHDAVRVMTLHAQGTSSDGIKRFIPQHHHRPIVAAAFMPGYKMRVITLGSNGKCKVTDFERAVTMIVTWDVGKPCLAMSVQSPGYRDASELATSGDDSEDAPHGLPPRPPDTSVASHLFAIGCSDGTVKVYNALGLLEADLHINEKPVLQLQWVHADAAAGLSGYLQQRDTVIINWPPGRSLLSQHTLQSIRRRKVIQREDTTLDSSPSISERGAGKPRLLEVHAPTTFSELHSRTSRPELESSQQAQPSGATEAQRFGVRPWKRRSKPALLDILNLRKADLNANQQTPPQKNLNLELPGTSPRTARYIPGESPAQRSYRDGESGLRKGQTSSMLGEGQPTAFSGQHQTSEHSDPKYKRFKPPSSASLMDNEDAHTSTPKPARSTVRPSTLTAFEASMMSGALLQSSMHKRARRGFRLPTPSSGAPVETVTNDQSAVDTSKPPAQRLSPGHLHEEPQTTGHTSIPEAQSRYDDSTLTIPSILSNHSYHTAQDGHERNMRIPGQYVEESEDESVFEDAQEYGEHHWREPWHFQHDAMPFDGGEHRLTTQSCQCMCADVVREEMILVRSELASLRKTIWALGTGAGTNRRMDMGIGDGWLYDLPAGPYARVNQESGSSNYSEVRAGAPES